MASPEFILNADPVPLEQELIRLTRLTFAQSLGTLADLGDLTKLGSQAPWIAPAVPPAPVKPSLLDRVRHGSALGLSGHHRAEARLRASFAAMEGVARRNVTNYTEGPQRWDGIEHARNPWAHPPQSPHDADCSAFTTWCLWIAIRQWRLYDFVNGEDWRAGYTGTQTQHGREVGLNELIPADLVFYGGSFSVPQHVCIYVGNGRVVSHGTQGDPRVYPVDLYGSLPIVQARRFIR